ncbi:uncharacterized protein LTR77_009094 [Saxophila tyrrhenica]|uniref:Uncharacterized protein n=1 Tax=Saxophila tyrrhenica TaxID=1690608 RepID=A0AAV9NZY0_9PEZI|nr:hypothetical protein LTR77_009094 [Saxophila tyrrhenica]
MPLSEADRRIRWIQVICWIPAIALLVPSAVTAHHGYFAMPMIPMSWSLIHGLIQIFKNPKNQRVNIALDLFLAVALMSFLIPYWIGNATGWGYGREVPRRDLRLLWDISGSSSSVHSHETKQNYSRLPAAEAGQAGGEYTDGERVEVRQEEEADEGTPRASVDDENARLL